MRRKIPPPHRALVAATIILISVLIVINFVGTAQSLLRSKSYSFEDTSSTSNEREDEQVQATENSDAKFQCRKYIILTTQRSGSSWFCQLLDVQASISCKARNSTGTIEMEPIKIVPNVWETYQESLLDAFKSAEELSVHCGGERAQTVSAAAAGFKLMYNQIPQQFIEDRRLQKFLSTQDVAVIHLVREAHILKLSSLLHAKEQSKIIGGWHTEDSAKVAQVRNIGKMTWNQRTISNVLWHEAGAARWDRIMQFEGNIKYHYVSYETLLRRADRNAQLSQVMLFLRPDGSTTLDSINHNTSRLQLHEPTCSSRVANYTLFRSHKQMSQTRTVAACDMLETYFGQDSDA